MPATGPNVSSSVIAMPARDAGEQGRLEERATELVPLAADEQLGTLLARVGDVALDLGERVLVDQRARR